MIRPSALFMLCLTLLLPMAAVARLDGPLEVTKPSKVRDLAEIRSSRTLRVLVNQSRNSSGEVQGQAIGVEYHRLRAFEQYLNGHARDGQEINLKIIPKAKDQLLGALARGEGDLVAPGELLDVKAAHKISTSDPIASGVPLWLVGVKGERRFTKLEQLSGRTVALTTGSAAADAISQVNQKLALHKQPSIKVEWVDPTLAVEDVLEMVQAGIFHLTIVEKPIAERWSKILPKLRFDKQVAISEPGDEYWFVRRTRRCCGPASIDFSRPIGRPPTRMSRSSVSIGACTKCAIRWPGSTASAWRSCARSCKNMRASRAWTG